MRLIIKRYPLSIVITLSEGEGISAAPPAAGPPGHSWRTVGSLPEQRPLPSQRQACIGGNHHPSAYQILVQRVIDGLIGLGIAVDAWPSLDRRSGLSFVCLGTETRGKPRSNPDVPLKSFRGCIKADNHIDRIKFSRG